MTTLTAPVMDYGFPGMWAKAVLDVNDYGYFTYSYDIKPRVKLELPLRFINKITIFGRTAYVYNYYPLTAPIALGIT